jgi:2-phospho-L-lactate/phosphoenolpyruvate guanylyltransferase
MSASPVWAVMPVKPFGVAKRRLASVLRSDERAQFARLMFEDVLDVLAAATVLSGIIVVTHDDTAGRTARARGAVVLDDPAGDINAAVRMGTACLAERRSAGMIVVPSDLPLLPPPLIEELADRILRTRAVVLVPATSDGGTNLLACSPTDAVSPSFGPNSFRRHRRAARSAGNVPTILASDDAGLDIDRARDLALFFARRSATRSHAFLAELNIEARLQRSAAKSHEPRQSLRA